jgi:NIMA (never in mitosis gene a)-related kinase
VKLAGLPKKEADSAMREATLLKSLHHPNIISYVESFTDSVAGKLYIVMEYADGGDLAGRIADVKKKGAGGMNEDEALNIFVQICLALKHLHDRHLIHRDLKAANVFLMKSGVVKLGDFGIARSLSNSADLAKTQIGTPYYLSPEICCTYYSCTTCTSFRC